MVSVIIPVYNVEKYVARCLDSVLNQTYQDFEIIVVDDCGNDGAMDIVNAYSLKDPRIKILHHDHNRGLLMARRTGYMAAKGEYIVFLDSDDYLLNHALGTLFNLISTTNSDIVCAEFQTVNDEHIIAIHQSNIEGLFSNIEVYELLLKKQIMHSLCGKIYNRTLFANSQELPVYENRTISEDMILFYTLVKNANNIYITNEIIYSYYHNHSSSTHTYYNDVKCQQLIFAIQYLFDLLLALNNDYLIEVSQKYFLTHIAFFMRIGLSNKYIHQLPCECLAYFNIKNLQSTYSVSLSYLYILLFKCSCIRNMIRKYNICKFQLHNFINHFMHIKYRLF